MAVYMVTFILSYLMCASAERISKEKNKILYRILLIGCVLIVSLVAGLRDYSVGTDILVYGNNLFFSASRFSDLGSFIKAYPDIEFLYKVLTYSIAKITENPNWLYFIIGLIIYGFTLGGILNFKRYISVPIAWLCFLFLFYGDTLNALRQFIAISISFWGLKYALSKDYLKYIIVVAIAMLFHATAFIAISVYLIYLVIKKFKSSLTSVFIIFLIIVITQYFNSIIQILLDFNVINSKYIRYVGSESGFDLKPIILRSPFVILIMLYFKRFYQYNNDRIDSLPDRNFGVFLFILLLIDMIVIQLRTSVTALYRVSYYFGYFKMISYSRISSVLTGGNKLLITLLLLIYLIVLWIYQNIFQGNNEIYPYTSRILRL